MQFPVRQWQWPSSIDFVIVCTVSMIGLAGFWHFPHLINSYGGGAFILVYVAAVLLMGIPLISGQTLLSRGSHGDVFVVMARWVHGSVHSHAWVWMGGFIVLAALLLVACYSVIGGWLIAYVMRSGAGILVHADTDSVQTQFNHLALDSERSLGWHGLFIILLVMASARGMRRGVLPVMRCVALALFVGLLSLLTATFLQPGTFGWLALLWQPDFSQLGLQGALEAIALAFFTLGLGTGLFMCLGAYLPAKAPILKQAAGIACLHTLVVFGFIIVLSQVMFEADAWLGQGVEQLFTELPTMLGGRWQRVFMFAIIWLVVYAGALGVLEIVVQMLQKSRQISRLRASIYAGIMVWVLGLVGLLSFGIFSSVLWHGVNAFNGMLWLNTQLLLPVVGLALSLFLGRVLSMQRLYLAWHPEHSGKYAFLLWQGLIRYPARMMMLLVGFYIFDGLSFVHWLWGW